MDIYLSFTDITSTIFKLFVLMSAGFIVHRTKIVDDGFVDKLSLLLMRLIVPALIISRTTENFSFKEYPYWWTLPVCAVCFSLIGMFIGKLALKLLKGFSARKELMCASGFHNCGYLPMNLILFSFTGILAERLLIYLFLFIVGFNLLVWSGLPLFFTGRLRSGMNWRVLLNPPVIATVFSIVWVAVFGDKGIPRIVLDPLRQIGNSAFPLAMLALGGYLSRYSAYKPENVKAIVVTSFAKLVFL